MFQDNRPSSIWTLPKWSIQNT